MMTEHWRLNNRDILAETWAVVCSQALGDQIIFVTRPDKKKILFYNDKHCQFSVDEGEISLSAVTRLSLPVPVCLSRLYFRLLLTLYL